MLPRRAYGQTDEFPFTSSLSVLKVTQIRTQGGFRTSRTSDSSCSVLAWYPSNGHVCHRNTTGSLHLSNLYLYALILPSENKFQFLKRLWELSAPWFAALAWDEIGVWTPPSTKAGERADYSQEHARHHPLLYLWYWTPRDGERITRSSPNNKAHPTFLTTLHA